MTYFDDTTQFATEMQGSAPVEPAGYCECDPVEVPGRPGIDCSACRRMRQRVDPLPIYYDEASDLRRAARLLEEVVGTDDLCAEDGLAKLARVVRDGLWVLVRTQDAIRVLVDEISAERQRLIQARVLGGSGS